MSISSPFIRDAKPPDHDRPKELKVRLSRRLHIRLHSTRILTGKSISASVTDALEAYFAGLELERGGR